MEVMKTILALWICFILTISFSGPCDLAYEFKKESLDGIVKEKYIQKWNHGYKYIEIEGTQNNKWFPYLDGDSSGAWDYIKVGDYVNKKPNSLIFTVSRDGSKREFKLNYGGCTFSD